MRSRIEFIFIYISHIFIFLGLWIVDSFKNLITGLQGIHQDMIDFIEFLKKKGKW
jgi:hypothetical protein